MKSGFATVKTLGGQVTANNWIWIIKDLHYFSILKGVFDFVHHLASLSFNGRNTEIKNLTQKKKTVEMREAKPYRAKSFF